MIDFSCRLGLICTAAGVVSGCLAFGDYELSEVADTEPEMPATGSETPVTPTPAGGDCDDGDYQCISGELRICTGGEWVRKQQCTSEQVCSPELGACVACEPGENYACDGTVLTRCNATGNAYDEVEDCAKKGLLCNTEVVPDSCFECIGHERRCDGTVLAKCQAHTFGGGSPCTLQPGCIPAAEGDDYCAECSTPGEEACDAAGARTRCAEDHRFEVLEVCEFGCEPQGATVSCRATAE